MGFNRLSKFGLTVVIIVTAAFSMANTPTKNIYYALKFHDHAAMDDLKQYTYSVINKGRVQVVELNEKTTFEQLPNHLQDILEPIDLKVLSKTPIPRWPTELKKSVGLLSVDPGIGQLLTEVTAESFTSTVTALVEKGQRSSDESIDWVMEQFQSYGYQPTHDYNVEAWKTGTEFPDEFVIIIGHMDTVSNTAGADDNASGATGVLEAARVLANIPTKRSILFLVTEDEERGLLGAKEYVRRLRAEGRLSQVKFAVNMDMIAYNSNGVVDLETEPQFESVADWMAEQVALYTSLSANKVLHAWGSDHVPFIDAGVPTLLTIEHWDTHTPCWHKSCDKLETLNIDYAVEVVRLNVAALSLQAETIFK